MTDVERLLQSALTPVEPSQALADRLEQRLTRLADAAAGELADLELEAMRDPRNWGRTAGAVLIGGAAAGGLALLQVRRRRKRAKPRGVRRLEQRIQDAADELRNQLRS
jgi:hypothetical protein